MKSLPRSSRTVPDPQSQLEGSEDPAAAEAPAPSLRYAWQIPAAALGAAALIGAVVYGVRHAPAPDRGAGLRKAEHEIKEHQYGEALATLNQDVLPLVAASALSHEQRREFHLLRARSLFLGQVEAGLNRAENHEAIVSEYREAEELHAELTPQDLAYLASACLSLGDLEKASATCDRLPPESIDARRDLLKKMIASAMDTDHPQLHVALDLLTRMSSESDLPEADRLWVLRRQSQLLVKQGFASDAINKILRTLPKLERSDPRAMGEVLVTLAEAYLAADDPRRAGEQLERALGLLGEGHELIPLATRLSAVVSVREGGEELSRARERYAQVVDGFEHSPERPEALLGLAEVEAQLADAQGEGTLDTSLEHYGDLVETLAHAGGDLRERTLTSLLARFAGQYEKADFHAALRFAELAEKLCGAEHATPEVLAALANTHRELAHEVLTRTAGGGALSLAEADPTTQREAREHLIRSGAYFRTHAGKVVQTDARAYGESLWSAADAFDRAGDLDASINAFRQFQADFPGDSRQPEAAFRLAAGYRARGDMALCAGLYRTLIAGRDGGGPSGQFADASYVPLAQALLADAEAANDAEAEALLLSVVRGEVGGVSTPMFKEAILALGGHYYQTGQYERAIERLEEYRERTGASEDRSSAAIGQEFRLADSYRLSAEGIEAALKTAMPDSQRVSMQQTRKQRLDKALSIYDEAARALEALPQRSATDELRLRNARFYLGDCAYGLADYDAAIRFYDAARDAYPKDPASLVAMVQIVSALLAQGKDAEAATANARAKRFYESLPETVWDDPTIPMTRRQWETWLDAQARLVAPAGETKAAGAGGD